MKERKKDKENLDRRKQNSAVLDVETDAPLTKAGFDEVLRKVSRKVTDAVSESESKDSKTSE